MFSAILEGYRNAFRGLPRQVWVLAGCLGINRLGMMVLPFLELYLTEERGLAIDEAGRIVALFGVGSIAGVWVGGVLADRHDPRRVQLGSLVAGAAFMVALWAARTPLAIAGALLLMSLATEVFRPANGAAVGRAVDARRRGRAFSLVMLAVNLGVSIGMPLGGFLAEIDFDWLFGIDAGTTLLAAVFLFLLGRPTGAPPPEPEPPPAPAAATPWRDRTFVLVVVLQSLTAAVLFQFFGALPVFLKSLGLSKAGVGWVLAANSVAIALFQMMVAQRIEGRDILPWMGFGSLMICLGYGLNLFVTSWPLAVVSVLVWTFGEMFYFPLAAAFATRRAPPGAMGRFLSFHLMGIAIGVVLAASIGTWVYEHHGSDVLWSGCAIAGVLIALAYGAVHRRERARA
jgi:predicted MFS family arabinose efflux permease